MKLSQDGGGQHQMLFMLWNALDTNNFYFILYYFSDFILILFSF